MATIQTSLKMYDGMTPILKSITKVMNTTINSFETMQDVSDNAINTKSLKTAKNELAKINVELDKVEKNIKQNTAAQKNFNSSVDAGVDSIMALAGGYVAVQGAQAGMAATDAYINTTAQLDTANTAPVEEVQQQVLVSATATGMDYGLMAQGTATLQMLAPEFFAEAEAAIAFLTTLYQLYRVTGVSAANAAAATQQLVQAITKGTLNGDELTSLMENAAAIPLIIEQYMNEVLGITGKSMKEMGEEGMITAEIIVASFAWAQDEINAAFQGIPDTFATTMNKIQNIAVVAFKPVMEGVNTWLNSEQGKNVVKAIGASMFVLAGILNVVLQLVADIGSWVVDNWPQIVSIIKLVSAATLVYVAATALSLLWEMRNNKIKILGMVIDLKVIRTRTVGIVSKIKDRVVTVKQSVATMRNSRTLKLNMALTAYATRGLIKKNIIQAKNNTITRIGTMRAAGHSTATMVMSVATRIATKATMLLNKAFWISPIGWISLLIIGLIMVIKALSDKTLVLARIWFGAWTFIGAVVYDVVALMYNVIGSFCVFMWNAFADPLYSISMGFVKMGEIALNIIYLIAQGLEAITRDRDFTSGIESALNSVNSLQAMEGPEDKTFEKMEYENPVEAFKSVWNYEATPPDYSEFQDMVASGTIPPVPIMAAPGGGSIPVSDPSSGDIANNTADIANSVDMSNEDLQYLRDTAERETINRYTTAEIKIDTTLNADISNDMDLDGVVDHIVTGVEEGSKAAAEGSHS